MSTIEKTLQCSRGNVSANTNRSSGSRSLCSVICGYVIRTLTLHITHHAFQLTFKLNSVHWKLFLFCAEIRGLQKYGMLDCSWCHFRYLFMI
ncbi:hypothetical protein GDO86_004661 [Hymenochirus boettgeri]|uniref:Uncharacterized protein n=1 Tax=Hymenochirus boettgeri TaxID=247094 RepID=A0A8T2KE97_9PIPI|nr:hypothetical protein GDO86_004661 [Hymenochirus boettgeri]